MTDGGRRSYDNVFKLTPEGAAQLAYNPDAICISIDLACSGEAVFNKQNPNCLRLCCSGIGGCRDECKGGGRFDGCGFRIELTTTLSPACKTPKVERAHERRPCPTWNVAAPAIYPWAQAGAEHPLQSSREVRARKGDPDDSR